MKNEKLEKKLNKGKLKSVPIGERIELKRLKMKILMKQIELLEDFERLLDIIINKLP